jgi:hypothetical protein
MARRSDAWKDLEREAARVLGGSRTPAAAGRGGADVTAPGVVVECKHRAASVHGSMYRAERAKRRLELADGARFVLVTRDRGREALATVTLAELAELLRPAGVARAESPEGVETAERRS